MTADPVVVPRGISAFDGVGEVNNTFEDFKRKPRSCESYLRLKPPNTEQLRSRTSFNENSTGTPRIIVSVLDSPTCKL